VLIHGESTVKSLNIPNHITAISNGILFHTSLEKLTVDTPISSNLSCGSNIDELVISPTTITSSADLRSNYIGKITIEDSETALNTSTFKCDVKEVYLGRDVYGGTFSGITSLENVVISDNVTLIGSRTFYECSGMRSLTFKDGDTKLTIGSEAFMSATPTLAYFGRQMNFSEAPCSALEKVEFGSNVTSIESSAFRYGNSIRTVISRNPVPPTTDDTFSNSTYLDGVLYVPEGSIAAYEEAPGWKNFWEIHSLDSYSGVDEAVAADKAQVSVDGGAICVSGAAEVRIVAMNGVTVYSGRGDCRMDVAPGIYVVIADNVTTKLAVK
jgi:hypothetical protein